MCVAVISAACPQTACPSVALSRCLPMFPIEQYREGGDADHVQCSLGVFRTWAGARKGWMQRREGAAHRGACASGGGMQRSKSPGGFGYGDGPDSGSVFLASIGSARCVCLWWTFPKAWSGPWHVRHRYPEGAAPLPPAHHANCYPTPSRELVQKPGRRQGRYRAVSLGPALAAAGGQCLVPHHLPCSRATEVVAKDASLVLRGLRASPGAGYPRFCLMRPL